MKPLLLVGALLISISINAQFSISAGANRLKENFGDNSGLFVFAKDQLYLYNSFVFQADYSKSFFRVYGEFGYMPESYELTYETSYSSGGGSSPFYHERREYHSTVNFKYLTYKIGIGTELKKDFQNEWWGRFSYNIFGQFDNKRSYSETDQVMYRTTITEPMPNEFLTTEYPSDYSPFKLLYYTHRIFQFGLELKGRLGKDRYFTELNMSLSNYNYYRSTYQIYSSDNDYQPTSRWCFSLGIKIGAYLFNIKNEE